MSKNLLYQTDAWQDLRRRVLRDEPRCRLCGARATVVDHILAHRGDLILFLDRANLQALCWSCHSSKTAKRDGGWGKAPSDRPLRGTAANGEPTDPDHPWHRKR